MPSWKDILIHTIKLADEVKRLNHICDKPADITNDIDKRVVRIETLMEVSKLRLPFGVNNRCALGNLPTCW